jgi:pimeloyl-ACP methyl ester carboxylesterase
MKINKFNDLEYVDTSHDSDVKRVILFLHGLSAGPESYIDAVKTLANDFRIIVPVLGSFKGYKIVNQKIEALLNELKIDKVIVIGHSAGGIYAINFAQDYQDKTSALILIDSVGICSEKTLLSFLSKWFKFVKSLFINHTRAFFIGLGDFLRTLFSSREIVHEVDFVRKYTLEKLNLKIPVLILWGKDDNLIPVSNAYKLNERISGSKLEIVDGNHSWLMINPQLFAKKIKEFVGE